MGQIKGNISGITTPYTPPPWVLKASHDINDGIIRAVGSSLGVGRLIDQR